MNRFSESILRLLPYLLFILGLLFSVFQLNYSFTNDELSALMRAQQPDFNALLLDGVKIDGHPAAAQIIIYFWTQWFGNTEWVVRLPFVLASGFTALLSFKLGKRLFGIHAALLFSMAISSLEFTIYHFQLARPYAWGLPIALASALYWFKIAFPEVNPKKPKVFDFVVFMVLSAAAAYHHYFSGLLAIIMALTLAFFIRGKRNWLLFLGLSFIPILLFLPHLEITLYQLKIGGVGNWLSAPSNNFIWLHLIHVFNQSVAFLLVIIGLVTLLYFQSKHKPKSENILFKTILLIWFLTPYIIGHLYSLYRSPVLQDRVLLFSLPFGLLFLFSFVGNLKTPFSKLIFLILVVSFPIHTFLIKKYHPQTRSLNFRQIAQNVDHFQSSIGEDSMLHLQHCNSTLYLKHYLKNDISFEINEISNESDLQQLQMILLQSNCQWVDYAVTKPVNRLSLMMIQSYYPIIELKQTDEMGDGYYLFKKGKPSIPATIPVVSATKSNFSMANIEFESGIEFLSSSTIKLNVLVQLRFDSINHAEVVYDLRNATTDESLEWWSIPLKYFWQKDNGLIYTVFPVQLYANQKLKIYLWNPQKENFNIQNYKIALYNETL